MKWEGKESINIPKVITESSSSIKLLTTDFHNNLKFRYVKSVQIRSFFWSVFSCIRNEYGDLLRKSSYSSQIQENTDQEKLRIWTLSTQCFKSILVTDVPKLAE